MLTGWDATVLANFALQDGTTFDVIVSQMNAALSALNAELYSDPIWSGLVSYQDTPEVEYRMGVSNGMNQFTEYGRPDAARAVTEGHMLPLMAFDRGLGWTWDYLRKARLGQIQADIADGIKDVRDRWRVNILTRLLQRGDDSGALKGLGASGLSAGFATTAASTGVDFTPPTVGGTAFASTHEHYVGITGGAMTAALFSDVKDELREHGHEPPFDFILGPTEETATRALTGFVAAPSVGVVYGNSTNVAALPVEADMNGSYFIGVISDIRVRVLRGIPQYYGFGYKSYGPNSQRNPVRIRLQKGQSRPQVTAMIDPRSGAGAAYPLQFMTLFTEFGVGVSDRTAGTPRYNNSATWADGTPT
jgi:hypothetical protein